VIEVVVVLGEVVVAVEKGIVNVGIIGCCLAKLWLLYCGVGFVVFRFVKGGVVTVVVSLVVGFVDNLVVIIFVVVLVVVIRLQL
jgi:hypothetical protein